MQSLRRSALGSKVNKCKEATRGLKGDMDVRANKERKPTDEVCSLSSLRVEESSE